MNALAVSGLKKRFGGVAALDGVDFAIEPGEAVAMIGPNGAGKSTCFNLLTGQLAPDAGQIELFGEPVAGQAPARIVRRGVGRTFQIATPFMSMSVGENLLCAVLAARGEARLWGRAARRHGEEIATLLAQVGLEGRAADDAASLAYGDRKRLDLALALAGEPRLLLMDEPTAGMAPAERGELMRLGFGLARERGLAVLFTEHDMEVVFGHATRVIVLDRGRIIARGTPEEIRADPQVQAVYLGRRGRGA